MYSRRDLGKLAAAGVPVALLAQKKKIDSTIKGVQLGAQTYSFRDLPLEGMIQAMVEVGLGDCEVYSPARRAETTSRGQPRSLRQWRIHAPHGCHAPGTQEVRRCRHRVSAYNLSFKDDFTDEEIDHGFQLSKAFRRER